MLDAEVLKDLRLGFSQMGNVSIREEKVDDGADLALKIHATEEGHNLIIVGRRHSTNSALLSGLMEWVEFPDLGPVGDILAEADISRLVSVLVIQQQLHMKIK